MEVLNKTSDSLKRCYNVLISTREIEDAVDAKLKDTAKGVKVNGFRQGKAPVDIVKRLYGNSVRPEAISDLINNLSKKIIDDEHLQIAVNYTNAIVKEDEKGIEFTLKFEVMPEVIEPDYSKFELVKHVAEITDKEINEILDTVRNAHKNWIDESDSISAKKGHKVIVDLVLKRGQKGKKNRVIKNLELIIGDENLLQDVWKPFEGTKVGDVKEFIVNYPANIEDKSLAGRSLEYSGTVRKIQRVEDFKNDDNFAKSLGYKKFEELHAWAVSRCTAKYEQMTNDVLKRDLLEKISSLCNFEVPEKLFNIEYTEVERQVKAEAKTLGHEITQKVIDGCKSIATDRVRLGFVISAVAKREKITVSNQEIAQAIRNLAQLYPGHERQIWDMYSHSETVNVIIGPILENKVVEHLLGIVKVKEEKCSVAELVAFDEEEFEFFKETEEVKKERKTEAKVNNKEEKPKRTRKKKEEE